jgi:hypothetical protein
LPTCLVRLRPDLGTPLEAPLVQVLGARDRLGLEGVLHRRRIEGEVVSELLEPTQLGNVPLRGPEEMGKGKRNRFATNHSETIGEGEAEEEEELFQDGLFKRLWGEGEWVISCKMSQMQAVFYPFGHPTPYA